MGQDAIDDFIALPQDQQLAALQKLPRANQDILLQKVKQRRSNTRPLPEGVKQVGTNAAGNRIIAPEETSAWDVFKQSVTDPEAWKNAGASAWSEVKSVPAGIASLFAPPASKTETAIGAVPGALPVKRLVGSELASRGKLTSQAAGQFASGHPVLGTASTVLAGLPIPGVAGMGAGINEAEAEGDTSGAIGKGAADIGMLASSPILKAGGEILRKGAEGVRKTAQSMVGAGGRVIKGEVTKAGEAAKNTDEAHAGEVQDALHETQGRELKHQQDLKTAQEDAANESKKQTATKISERNQAIEDRRAAEEKLTAEKLKQGKIGPTQAKLQTAWSNLRAGIETAREKALKIGNDKYSAVNAELNPLSADPEFMKGALVDAMEKIKGTSTEPPIFKDMARKSEHGEVPTYEDLQGYYSELGTEISKGSLAGDVFHAYDTLHEAIGEEMQRIADSQGKGAALTDARAYWKRMKQTFGKPFNPTDAATKTLESSAPDVATAEEQANRVRLLGSFDPDIPKLFSHIENIQKGAQSLPKPTPERVLTQKAKVPSIPARTGPVKVEPELPKEPDRVPIPDRPEQTTVDTRLARERLVDKWASGETGLNKWQVRAMLSGGIGSIAGLLAGHGVGLEVAGAVSAGTYVFGPGAIASLLDKPAFRGWITRPPTGELETLQKLPNADRIKITDGLKKVVSQAQKQGIKVSPALITLVGRSAAPTPPAIQGSPVDDQ